MLQIIIVTTIALPKLTLPYHPKFSLEENSADRVMQTLPSLCFVKVTQFCGDLFGRTTKIQISSNIIFAIRHLLQCYFMRNVFCSWPVLFDF